MKRLYATADLHADFGDNWTWLSEVPRTGLGDAGLIVAGDIGHRLQLVEDTLSLLRRRFGRIFFVPGNHDLWVEKGAADSLQKMAYLLDVCLRLGIDTGPGDVAGARVVPLYSWYDPKFGGEGGGPPKGWADRRYCRWPEEIEPVDRYMDGLNGASGAAGPLLTFSHFVPRLDLLPHPAFLRFKALPHVAGSRLIEARLRALGSRLHFFGHTHIRCDQHLGGVHYLQDGLGYPRERRRRGYAFKRLL